MSKYDNEPGCGLVITIVALIIGFAWLVFAMLDDHEDRLTVLEEILQEENQ